MDFASLYPHSSVGDEQEFAGLVEASVSYPRSDRTSTYPEEPSVCQTAQMDHGLAMDHSELMQYCMAWWQFNEGAPTATTLMPDFNDQWEIQAKATGITSGSAGYTEDKIRSGGSYGIGEQGQDSNTSVSAGKILAGPELVADAGGELSNSQDGTSWIEQQRSEYHRVLSHRKGGATSSDIGVSVMQSRTDTSEEVREPHGGFETNGTTDPWPRRKYQQDTSDFNREYYHASVPEISETTASQNSEDIFPIQATVQPVVWTPSADFSGGQLYHDHGHPIPANISTLFQPTYCAQGNTTEPILELEDPCRSQDEGALDETNHQTSQRCAWEMTHQQMHNRNDMNSRVSYSHHREHDTSDGMAHQEYHLPFHELEAHEAGDNRGSQDEHQLHANAHEHILDPTAAQGPGEQFSGRYTETTQVTHPINTPGQPLRASRGYNSLEGDYQASEAVTYSLTPSTTDPTPELQIISYAGPMRNKRNKRRPRKSVPQEDKSWPHDRYRFREPGPRAEQQRLADAIGRPFVDLAPIIQGHTTTCRWMTDAGACGAEIKLTDMTAHYKAHGIAGSDTAKKESCLWEDATGKPCGRLLIVSSLRRHIKESHVELKAECPLCGRGVSRPLNVVNRHLPTCIVYQEELERVRGESGGRDEQ